MIALIKNAKLKDLVAAVPELTMYKAKIVSSKVKVEGHAPMEPYVFREWFLDRISP